MLCSVCNLLPAVNGIFCKKCRIKRGYDLFKERKKIPYSKAWFNHIRKTLNQRAKKRGIKFELSCADIAKLYDKSIVNCPYCENSIQEVSLDRINNELGYTLNNCIVACRTCNRTKSNLTVTQITNMYKTMKDRI